MSKLPERPVSELVAERRERELKTLRAVSAERVEPLLEALREIRLYRAGDSERQLVLAREALKSFEDA